MRDRRRTAFDHQIEAREVDAEQVPYAARTELEHDAVDDGRVGGVEIKAVGRPPLVVPARQVVVASGGIENARLLMLSDPEGIRKAVLGQSTGTMVQ